MKNIGIITFQNAHNYGAVLQCVALKTFLSKAGYSVSVIDHHNQKIEGVYSINQPLPLECNLFQKLRQKISLSITHNVRKKRIEKFNNFIDFYINPQSEEGISQSKYQVLIWGSDQIWRSEITGGDDFFWGQIRGVVNKKITYAASSGKIGTFLDKKIANLRDFDAIGVRELDLKNYLNQIGVPATLNVDPTLLLNEQEWLQLLDIKRSTKKPYVLVYAMRNREAVMSYAKQIAGKQGLQIKEIFNNCYLSRYIFKRNYASSPIEFVSSIYNAKYIITDSFHGTVFSIIFQKQFSTIRLNDGLDSRVESFLSQLTLSDRLTTDPMTYNSIIDYKNIEDSLNTLRQASINYLINSIES